MGMGKGSYDSVDVPEAEEVPSVESTGDPVSEAVRDEEARKLRLKRGAAGTILTSPLGVSSTDDTLLS